MESEGDLDISDDDDGYCKKKARGGQRGKSGRIAKGGKGQRSLAAPSRRKKGKMSDDEFSAEDSDDESDEDFRARKSAHGRKNSNMGRRNETRTSSRSVRKVSYVESDESEEIEEGKNKKSQKVYFPHFLILFHSCNYTSLCILFRPNKGPSSLL